MDKQKGIAFCGLACCLCEEHPSCKGCRRGDCPEAGGCKPYQCAQTNGHEGCWECPQFPCDHGRFQSMRIRAFVAYCAQYGQAGLLSALEKGENIGLQYHYPGKLVGDYDTLPNENELISMLASL